MKIAIALAKNVLAPLGITAAASAIDAGIQKKIHGSGTTILIISNEEMNDIMKIVQALACVINLDEYADVDTHWIALFCNRSEIVYFDSFGVEHVPEEI